MTPEYMLQRARKIDSTLTLRDIIELINDGMREAYEELGEESYVNANVVEDQRFVDLGDVTVTEVVEVYYMDSEGRYRPILEYLGKVDIGDST